jgi:hypothetical protein
MSLTNVFNDVINQSNQTKTFGSGLNQKRFSGKVSTAAVKMGSTKGRGSTTRMYNYCTQHSEAPSECINEFISQAPPPISSDILFNISTFSNLFNYDGTEPKKLPTKYLNGLISAANRWNQFIKFNRDTINLIRNISTNNKNWNGIELTNVTYVTRSIEAAVRTTVINYTTLNISFTLEINDVAISSLDNSSISDIFTHELGHTLGFSNWSSRVDGKADGAILLPYLITNTAFYNNPWCTIDPPYKNMNIGYNNYWGTIDWENRKIDGKTTPLNIIDNKGTHLYPGHFGSIEEAPPNPNYRANKYIKRGFANEIMLPQFVNGRKFFISQVSLGYLLDLFTNWRGTNYFNYVLKNGKSEVTKFSEPRPGGGNADFTIYFNEEKSFQLDSNNNISKNNISKNIEETTIMKTFNCECCDIIHLKI